MKYQLYPTWLERTIHLSAEKLKTGDRRNVPQFFDEVKLVNVPSVTSSCHQFFPVCRQFLRPSPVLRNLEWLLELKGRALVVGATNGSGSVQVAG
jgi:hypothetical protein